MPRLRYGWTLLELLLVLAILVVVASLALPALTGSLRSQRLARAGDLVRAAFGKTRIAAMKTGRIHLFRFSPGDRQYLIEMWQGEDVTTAPAVPGFRIDAQNAAGEDSLPGNASLGMPQQLPEGIAFLNAETRNDSRSLRVQQQDPGMRFGAPAAGLPPARAPLEDGLSESTPVREWSRPILFYPDGTATDARIILGDERGLRVIVELRGLTGITQVSDVLDQEEVGL